MTKEQKFKSIATAMTTKTRADDSTFTCFSDEAPEELRELYLKHYNVRDLDYEIFSRACNWISEQDYKAFIKDDFEYNDMSFASIYTSDRLSYLNILNEEEIADYMKQGFESISRACAYWYDNQVEDAIYLIRNWVLRK